MTTSRFPDITDELLSAYLDNAVTTGERARIEQAASEDATIAWRLATLRETVTLLRALPVLNAPRAFVLTPEMVGQSRTEPALATGVAAQSERPVQRPLVHPPAPQPGWWERLADGWRAFWAGGNPVWRNALATSMAALLVLLVLPALLRNNTTRDIAATPIVSLASQEGAAAPADAVVEEMAIATRAEVVASAAAKQTAAATAVPVTVAIDNSTVTDNNSGEDAETLTLATGAPPAQAPLARVAEDEVVAPPAEAEVVVAAEVTVRTIPGARATEDILSGVASAESAPAYAAAVSAPSVPEAAADSALLAAPATDAAAAAVPASPQTLAADASNAPAVAATSIETMPSTATSAPTAAPTVAAVAGAAEANRKRIVITAAPVAVATMPTPPGADNAWTQLLPWLQLTALAGVVGFGLLWWRSRRARI